MIPSTDINPASKPGWELDVAECRSSCPVLLGAALRLERELQSLVLQLRQDRYELYNWHC